MTGRVPAIPLVIAAMVLLGLGAGWTLARQQQAARHRLLDSLLAEAPLPGATALPVRGADLAAEFQGLGFYLHTTPLPAGRERTTGTAPRSAVLDVVSGPAGTYTARLGILVSDRDAGRYMAALLHRAAPGWNEAPAWVAGHLREAPAGDGLRLRKDGRELTLQRADAPGLYLISVRAAP